MWVVVVDDDNDDDDVKCLLLARQFEEVDTAWLVREQVW